MRSERLLLLLCCLAASTTSALVGTVKDGKGAPVSGASLHFSSVPARTTLSDQDGRFTLVPTTGLSRGEVRSSGEAVRVEIREGRLLVSTERGADPGAVSLLSADGSRHPADPPTMVGPEGWSYRLPSVGPGVYMVQAPDGAIAARLVRAGNDWVASAPESDPGASARAAAAVDTLVASKAGYATTRSPLASYDAPVDIVLDSLSTAGRSAGCDKTRTLANGTLSLQSGGKTRKYILKTPADYDKSHPYRLVFAYAESGSSAQSVANRNYFRMAGYDAKNTIFVAPDAENGAGTWSKNDVAFTDDILAQVEGDLCIDKTRIFATGFSFGGAMSIAIACTRADVFRGVAFFSGADLTGSCPTTLTKPIAYYASQASGDASGTPTPTSGRTKQAQFAAVNGCTADANAIVFPGSGKAHTCTVYKNCKAGYPTVYCVFDGAHGWEPLDPGQSTSWDPPEAWKFITQF